MTTNNKCVMNFSSQYAYLDNNQHIHIDYYIQNKEIFNHTQMSCIKGHELICVNGKKNNDVNAHKMTVSNGFNIDNYVHKLEYNNNIILNQLL